MWSLWNTTLLFLSMSILAKAGSGPACYQRRNDQIILQPNWFACSNTGGSGGVQLCCRDGDLCGQDSICRSPDVQEGNEWYVGGCTDKTYEDKGCSYDCTSYKQTWATYNVSGHGYWACCGDYDCADGPPTTRRFQGVSPSKWSAISTAGQTSGLSQAAKIGIGVAVGVVLAAIIGFITFCLLRRRGKSSRHPRGFGHTAKSSYREIDPQGDVLMATPFVAGENQPYSRPSSPMPGTQVASGYSDQRASRDLSRSPLHQPPEQE